MCRTCNLPAPDPAAVDTFGERLLDMLNQGFLSLMVSLGHRSGLYDTMAELSHARADEIARHAGLDTRYVTEWLGAMVAGGLVEYDAETSSYLLPPSHAALLTRAAAPDNVAVFAQYVAVLGQVEDRILECFREGGGVDYEHYARFHEVMAEDSGQTVLSALDDHILPLLGAARLRSLEEGVDVLDVGCGRGHALVHLARRFPRSRFVGYELSAHAVDFARSRAQDLGLENVIFEVRDLTDFDTWAAPGRFDLITAFDAIHDQATPDAVLRGVHRSLAEGGTFLMQDIRASSRLENNLDHPVGPMLYTISTMHCMSVSLAQGGAGLGTMWGEELAVEMLEAAGFDAVEIRRLDHDFQNNFYLMTR